MRNLKRLGIWVLISLFLQSAVLLYLDKFYFVTETSFKATKVDNPVKVKSSNAAVAVPENAKQLSLSYDGKFLAYYDGNLLKVANTLTGDVKSVQIDQGSKVSYYKWSPDINNMIIAEKKSSSKGDTIIFSNYDAQKDKKKAIESDNRGNSVSVLLPDKKSEVEDIEISTLTNMIYVKVKNSGNRSSIYAINVMAQIEKLKLSSYFPGDIVTFPHEARMAYEDLTYHRIYVTGISNPITIKGVTNPALIAADDEDRLYIGQLDNGKIKKIYFGSLSATTDKWQSFELKSPADKKDIFVSTSGTIYINNNLKGIVTNITTNKDITYKGRFIQMYNGGIASVVDGKLSKINLNSKE